MNRHPEPTTINLPIIAGEIPKSHHTYVSTEHAERFLKSLRTAADCRFEASSRLKYRGITSFSVTTALSLGLIFIPLMQAANLNLSLSSEILNMLSIFLAVSVLVFSIINSQARYGVRSVLLNACGDQIKTLARHLSARISQHENQNQIYIQDVQESYYNIKVDVENHSQLDYGFIKLRQDRYFHNTECSGKIDHHWLVFTFRHAILLGRYLFPYTISFLILCFLLILILDMLSITTIISPVFDKLL